MKAILLLTIIIIFSNISIINAQCPDIVTNSEEFRNCTLGGHTFELGDDITIQIENLEDVIQDPLAFDMDGNDYTIYLNVTEPINSEGEDFGIFNKLRLNTKFENVNIRTVQTLEIEGKYYVGLLAGRGDGITVSNVNVEANIDSSSTSFKSFGTLLSNASNSDIENVRVKNTNINSNQYRNFGGLVGYVNGSSLTQINDCSFSGTINQTEASVYFGGIVGRTDAKIEINNCEFDGKLVSDKDLQSTHYLGGIVAFANVSLNSVNMNSCLTKGSIHGNNYVGGIVGEIIGNVKIDNTLARMNIEGDQCVGGFVGKMKGNSKTPSITNSSTEEISVTGNGNVGGFVGEKYNSSAIHLSSANVTLKGTNKAGGFAGHMYTTESDSGDVKMNNITQSYAIGSVITNDKNSHQYIGGIVGRIENAYLKNIYSMCSIDASMDNSNKNQDIGGIVGWSVSSSDRVEIGYAVPSISVSNGETPNEKYIGCVGGDLSSSNIGEYFNYLYYDKDICDEGAVGSNGGSHDGIKGLTTSQMQDENAPNNMHGFYFNTTWTPIHYRNYFYE